MHANHLHGGVKSEEVKVMMEDAELLQPGVCSTVKMDHPSMLRCLWPNPKIPLQLVSS